LVAGTPGGSVDIIVGIAGGGLMARSRQPDKVEALGQIPLFADLDKKQLAFIAGQSSELTIKAGSHLAEEGVLGREAMVILSGSAEARRSDTKIADLGPGDVVGEMSLINDAPRTATVTAVSDCTLLVMNSREFSSILEANPDVSIKILKTVAARLVENQPE
jgi:CRP-like cAMP-binding protein